MGKTKDIDPNIEVKFHLHKDLKQFTPSRLKYLREQVARIKLMPQPEQRTEAWYSMREDRITASDFATALDQSPYQTRSLWPLAAVRPLLQGPAGAWVVNFLMYF